MSSRPSLPQCATTGIGGLPYLSVEPSMQVAFGHDVPFLPQLPKAGAAELMIPAALEGLPGLAFEGDGVCTVDVQVWSAQRDRFTSQIEEALSSGELTAFEPSVAASRAFRPFLAELERRTTPIAKVQLAGPATVRWYTRTSDGKTASELPELDQQLFRLSMARARALVRAVKRTGALPLLFLDEPGLVKLEPQTHARVLKELEVLIMAVQREGALVGIHCCGNTRWGAVLALGADVISFDARLSLDAMLDDDAAAFWQFVAGGGRVALGVVPTEPGAVYALPELCDSIEAALRSTAPRDVPLEQARSQLMLTPACGLGLRSEADAERIVGEVREAQRRITSW